MTPWEYAADISAAVGGIASLIAVVIGAHALRDSHGARLDAARDRERQNLQRVADQIELMNKSAWIDMQQTPQRNDWRDGIELLNRYLAATAIPLARCHELTEQGSAMAAALIITAARQEVFAQLLVLTARDAADAAEKPSFWHRLTAGSPTC